MRFRLCQICQLASLARCIIAMLEGKVRAKRVGWALCSAQPNCTAISEEKQALACWDHEASAAGHVHQALHLRAGTFSRLPQGFDLQVKRFAGIAVGAFWVHHRHGDFPKTCCSVVCSHISNAGTGLRQDN